MSKDSSLSDVEVTFSTESAPRSAQLLSQRPLVIAVLGDFSARHNQRREDSATVGQREKILVDRDNFDDVLRSLDIQLSLPVGSDSESRLTMRFEQLDDFHPDRIFERLEIFSGLRQTRRKLLNRETFAEAAAEVSRWANADNPTDQTQAESTSRQVSAPSSEPDLPTGADLLDATLAATQNQQQPTTTAAQDSSGLSLVERMIRDIVAPYIIPAADPRQDDLVRSVDQATSEQMRRILHHRDFQALEAIWRGLYFLVRRLETGSRLKLLLVDISRRELMEDLISREELAECGTFKLLTQRDTATTGGEPPGLIVGHYTFQSSPDDVMLVQRMAKVAAHTGAAFVSAASSNVVGCSCFAATPDPDNWQPADAQDSAAWSALRGSEHAPRVSLATPRFLLRLPYGRDCDPIEQFEFEESQPAPAHENYLWGNPAVACAYLIGRNFEQHGWNMELGQVEQIEGLPLHVYREDGESQITPVAESWLGERAVRAITALGLTPLVSVRNRDAVQIHGIRSIAEPPAPLAGPWSP